MKTFFQYCQERKYKIDISEGFIQIHKDVFIMWKLYLKELTLDYFLKHN